MIYEKLQKEAASNELFTYEKPLRAAIKGLYAETTIWVNSTILTSTEKGCILAEELGHYHTTYGDITDQRITSNRKHEKRARIWAYERLLPLTEIVRAHKLGIRNKHELAELLEVTEEFLQSALDRYLEKYGLWVSVGKYTVCFEPLGVLEMFE